MYGIGSKSSREQQLWQLWQQQMRQRWRRRRCITVRQAATLFGNCVRHRMRRCQVGRGLLRLPRARAALLSGNLCSFV